MVAGQNIHRFYDLCLYLTSLRVPANTLPKVCREIDLSRDPNSFVTTKRHAELASYDFEEPFPEILSKRSWKDRNWADLLFLRDENPYRQVSASNFNEDNFGPDHRESRSWGSNLMRKLFDSTGQHQKRELNARFVRHLMMGLPRTEKRGWDSDFIRNLLMSRPNSKNKRKFDWKTDFIRKLLISKNPIQKRGWHQLLKYVKNLKDLGIGTSQKEQNRRFNFDHENLDLNNMGIYKRDSFFEDPVDPYENQLNKFNRYSYGDIARMLEMAAIKEKNLYTPDMLIRPLGVDNSRVENYLERLDWRPENLKNSYSSGLPETAEDGLRPGSLLPIIYFSKRYEPNNLAWKNGLNWLKENLGIKDENASSDENNQNNHSDHSNDHFQTMLEADNKLANDNSPIFSLENFQNSKYFDPENENLSGNMKDHEHHFSAKRDGNNDNIQNSSDYDQNTIDKRHVLKMNKNKNTKKKKARN